MKIGFVVDGESEFVALKKIWPQLRDATGHTLLDPALAKIPPKAPLPTIAKVCERRISAIQQKKTDRVIVLMDREDRGECPGELATALTVHLSRVAGGDVVVVIKEAMFENWLIADLGALKMQPGRFVVSRSLEQAVAGGRADAADALVLMKRAVQGDYDKVEDSRRILERADVGQMARHSRSFRRLLRLVEHPAFLTQSAAPLSN